MVLKCLFSHTTLNCYHKESLQLSDKDLISKLMNYEKDAGEAIKCLLLTDKM